MERINKTTLEKEAAILHQSMYAYGKLKTMEKVLTVSGILIALNHGFSIEQMGKGKFSDGALLYYAIMDVIKNTEMDEGKNIIAKQFEFLKETETINKIHPTLQKTPLQHFTEFLNEKIYIPYLKVNTSEDYIGRFYTEFMSYESSEGQNLGIILTPAHITSLFADLLNVTPDDVILDPCVGTAGFLIGGMQKELEYENAEENIVRNEHFFGFEVQHYMFTVACVNLIVRGCKKIHIRNTDFLESNAEDIQKEMRATVGMINPPYSLGTSEEPKMYEINFIKHLLDSVKPGGRVAAIVPTSSMTGKTKEVKQIKKEILQKHTLEGVITMNPNTFYGVDTQTAIAVFTAGAPHPKNKLTKFIDFREDGYEVSPHIGLIKTESADIKRNYLLDVWNDIIEGTADFCIREHVTAKDEWLYSNFHFRDEIPYKFVFEARAKDYLKFRSNAFYDEKEYLFIGQPSFANLPEYHLPTLEEKTWKPFHMTDVFHISGTKVTDPNTLIPGGKIPRVCCAKSNNGIEDTYQNIATEEGNVLTVDSATVGNIHYQQVPFSSSSHVEKLTLKDGELNVFLGLFLASAISFAIEGKYNYGYKFSKARMKRQTIMLPVDDTGEIDYAYMENYMKTILNKKWKKIIEMF